MIRRPARFHPASRTQTDSEVTAIAAPITERTAKLIQKGSNVAGVSSQATMGRYGKLPIENGACSDCSADWSAC